MSTTATPHLPGSRPGTVLVPQGALVRGPAFIIDTFLCSLVAAVILGGQAPLTRIILVTLAVEFVYFAALEGILGTTLGKRLFGLRVVRAADGRPCGPLAAVVRTVLRLVDNILFSLPGITAIVQSPRRQRLGDRAAKTLVVSEVPEQLLKVFGGLTRGGAVDPEEMAKRLNGLAEQHQAMACAECGRRAERRGRPRHHGGGGGPARQRPRGRRALPVLRRADERGRDRLPALRPLREPGVGARRDRRHGAHPAALLGGPQPPLRRAVAAGVRRRRGVARGRAQGRPGLAARRQAPGGARVLRGGRPAAGRVPRLHGRATRTQPCGRSRARCASG